MNLSMACRIGGRHVFHVVDALVSSFDLEGGNPGRNQVRNGIHPVQIFEGEEKLLLVA